MSVNRHIASKCRFTLLDGSTHMMIFRRDGGVLDKVRRFSTSKPHGVRCKMLFWENRSKCGVKAFDDGNRNPSRLIGASWHFYLSSAAIHSDSKNAATRSKTHAKRNVDKFMNLKKKTEILLTEDIWGKTKSLTTRMMFHKLIYSLTVVDQPWAVDASIKLLGKMWDWDNAGNKQLTPGTGEDMRYTQ